MSKAINAAVLGVILFLLVYCLCFWFGVMPKFYPVLGQVRITPPPGNPIAVKFVGAAWVALAAGFVGFLVGLALPLRSAAALHILAWVTMVAATVYLIGRETAEYILG
jgi:predicted small integral membrane protein